MIYLTLYFEFLKIGLFAFGGGLATIPFFYQLSYKTGWFSVADIVNMFAISQVTPGAPGINMATFAGFHVGGVLGAVAATLGIVMPALLIIIAMAGILKKFMDNKYFKSAFKGMAAGVCALITVAVLHIAMSGLVKTEIYLSTGNIADLVSTKALVLFAVLLIAINRFRIHPFFYICISAVLGIFVKF